MTSKQKENRRNRLIEKYGKKCFWCGKDLDDDDITLDHYIPKFEGGPNATDNLRLACVSCNHKRHRLKPKNKNEHNIII